MALKRTGRSQVNYLFCAAFWAWSPWLGARSRALRSRLCGRRETLAARQSAHRPRLRRQLGLASEALIVPEGVAMLADGFIIAGDDFRYQHAAARVYMGDG